ncbi:hypothetical protein [Marinifilum caeruleilacunae]|nr:hypothetical protein [Marinifilum caeruleilacunae]
MSQHNINRLIGKREKYMPVFSGLAFADWMKVKGLGSTMSILK